VRWTGACAVVVDVGLGLECSRHTGCVSGLHMPGADSLVSTAFESRAGFGSSSSVILAHAVGFLIAPRKMARAGPGFDIGERRRGCTSATAGRRPYAERGRVLAGDAGQVRFAGLKGLEVDCGGQIGEEPADDANSFVADRACGLGGGPTLGSSGLAVRGCYHRDARPKVSGLSGGGGPARLIRSRVDSTVQDLPPNSTGMALRRQAVGEPVIVRRLAATSSLETILDGRGTSGADRASKERAAELGLGGVIPVETAGDGLPIRRDHPEFIYRTNSSNHDRCRKLSPGGGKLG